MTGWVFVAPERSMKASQSNGKGIVFKRHTCWFLAHSRWVVSPAHPFLLPPATPHTPLFSKAVESPRQSRAIMRKFWAEKHLCSLLSCPKSTLNSFTRAHRFLSTRRKCLRDLTGESAEPPFQALPQQGSRDSCGKWTGLGKGWRRATGPPR